MWKGRRELEEERGEVERGGGGARCYEVSSLEEEVDTANNLRLREKEKV